MISASTQILAVIGRPVRHSKSPELHNRWIKTHQLDMVYVALPVEDISKVADSVRNFSIRGLNVTLPFKQSIIPYLDELSDDAKQIGAVNTVVNEEGKLIGHNTDYLGFDAAISTHIKSDSNVLILGAGGAAQASAYAFQQKKLKVDINNRSVDKAEQTAEKFDHTIVNESELFAKKYDLIVNTTSIGLKANECPIDLNRFDQKPGFIYDMIYEPEQSQLLKDAERLSIDFENGESMFIGQGRHSFKLWTGILPD